MNFFNEIRMWFVTFMSIYWALGYFLKEFFYTPCRTNQSATNCLRKIRKTQGIDLFIGLDGVA